MQSNTISEEQSIITLLPILPLHLVRISTWSISSFGTNGITAGVLPAVVECHEGGEGKGHGDEGDENAMAFDEP